MMTANLEAFSCRVPVYTAILKIKIQNLSLQEAGCHDGIIRFFLHAGNHRVNPALSNDMVFMLTLIGSRCLYFDESATQLFPVNSTASELKYGLL